MTALVTRTYPANGHALTFRGDGWFNMTTAAKAFGKQLQHFWHSPHTTEYMGALADSLSSNSNEKPVKLMDIRKGSGLYPTTGTWAHPKLAVFFAQCSP